MFDGLGAYATAAKWATYLAILTLIISALRGVYVHIDTSGYNRAMLEIAGAANIKEQEYAKKIKELENINVPEPITVIETIEVVKNVTKIIEKEIFVCDDLGSNFIRVRNDTRNCIFNNENSGRDCIQ